MTTELLAKVERLSREHAGKHQTAFVYVPGKTCRQYAREILQLPPDQHLPAIAQLPDIRPASFRHIRGLQTIRESVRHFVVDGPVRVENRIHYAATRIASLPSRSARTEALAGISRSIRDSVKARVEAIFKTRSAMGA